jgi:hypothetical protein
MVDAPPVGRSRCKSTETACSRHSAGFYPAAGDTFGSRGRSPGQGRAPRNSCVSVGLLWTTLAGSSQIRQAARCFSVDDVTASWADGDDLHRVGAVLTRAEPVDHAVALRSLAGNVEAEAAATFQVTTHPSGPERLAGPAPPGQVADCLKGRIDERLVQFCQTPQVIEDLRQEAAMPGRRHRSAIAVRVPAQRRRCGVEVDPGAPGHHQALARLGCIQRVLERRSQLHPQLPRDDHPLRLAMTAKGHRFGATPALSEVSGDLAEPSSRFGRRQHLGGPR